jgi:hypothetical protein
MVLVVMIIQRNLKNTVKTMSKNIGMAIALKHMPTRCVAHHVVIGIAAEMKSRRVLTAPYLIENY